MDKPYIILLRDYLNHLTILIEAPWNNIKIITNNEKLVKKELFTFIEN